MPYHIKQKAGCYSVMNSQTGFIHAKCTTKKKAEAQIRLLESIHNKKMIGGATPEERGYAAQLRQMYDHRYLVDPRTQQIRRNNRGDPMTVLDEQYGGVKTKILLNNVIHQFDNEPLRRVDYINDKGKFINPLLNPFTKNDLSNIGNHLRQFYPSSEFQFYSQLKKANPNFTMNDIPPQYRGERETYSKRR